MFHTRHPLPEKTGFPPGPPSSSNIRRSRHYRAGLVLREWASRIQASGAITEITARYIRMLEPVASHEIMTRCRALAIPGDDQPSRFLFAQTLLAFVSELEGC
jgi:hypothetical protein